MDETRIITQDDNTLPALSELRYGVEGRRVYGGTEVRRFQVVVSKQTYASDPIAADAATAERIVRRALTALDGDLGGLTTAAELDAELERRGFEQVEDYAGQTGHTYKCYRTVLPLADVERLA